MNYKGSNKFGVLPRRTMIANQPHMLAYINPQEEMLLRKMGGTGQAGPMGVPAYPPMGDYAYDGGAGTFSGGDRGGGGNPGVSANAYNAAIGRVNQPFERGYNQDARNRDLATIDAYNASFAPVNDPSEIATPAISSPVSDDGFLGVSDGGSGYVDYGTDAVSTSPVEVTVDPTNTSGATTTSLVGTSMFDNMRALRGLPPLGSSGYVSVDAMADTTPDVGFVPDNYTPDLGGYIGEIDDDGLPNVDVNESDFIDDPYAIDITDTNIYTENPDGTYTVEDGEPDPIEMSGDGEGEPPANGGDTVGETDATDTLPSSFDRVEYNFNTSLDPSQYGGMWSNITSTIPKYEFNAYEDEDGLLRFSDNDEVVPEDILKYMPYAKKTLVEEETEEEETETEEE